MKVTEACAILGLTIWGDLGLKADDVRGAFVQAVLKLGPDQNTDVLKAARDALLRDIQQTQTACPKCGGRGFVGKLGATVKCSCR